MRTSQSGIDLIKYFEGFSPTTYLDAAGLPTIGYGHLIRNNERFLGRPINHQEAEDLLKDDLITAERSVMRLVKRELNCSQFDALVSFVFNLGGAAFERSTLRQKINYGADNEVPEQFMRWVWAGGRKMPGLMRRRAFEAMKYMTEP